MPIRHAAITACQRSPRTKRRLRIQPGPGSRAESTVRAVLEQQASCVLELPGGLQDDVHAIGIFDKSVWRLHVHGLSECLRYRQFGLASIAKDAHDPAGFNRYANLSHGSIPRSPTSQHLAAAHRRDRAGRSGETYCDSGVSGSAPPTSRA
jgi:hypothetical protein